MEVIEIRAKDVLYNIGKVGGELELEYDTETDTINMPVTILEALVVGVINNLDGLKVTSK
jgi:hypothetical protein